MIPLTTGFTGGINQKILSGFLRKNLGNNTPDVGTNAKRRYLMLYDTVPGGTGYLKDLMTEPRRLLEVFQIAWDALKACSCNQDPAKDGCYRCLYAYRRSRDMAETSRDTALEILEGILERAEDLEPVDGLAKVKSNALVKSVLEARFIEALGRMKVGGQAVVVRQDLVQGKPGYVLKVADRTYFMEPQVNLGAEEGVAVPSCPDFVIRPARSSEGRSAIAVFTDGFEPHQHLTHDDSVKRMSLVRAGYLQWSLTWQDVETAFGKTQEAFDLLTGFTPAPALAEMQERLDERWQTAALRSRFGQSALALLVEYLASADAEKWKRAVFTALLCQFDQQHMLRSEMRAKFTRALASKAPGQARDAIEALGERRALGGCGRWLGCPPDSIDLFVALPLKAAQSGEPDDLGVVLHLNDDARSRQSPDYRRAWNGTLRLFNLLQFLRNPWWTTQAGVEKQVYPEFEPTGEQAVGVAATGEWAEVLELVADELSDQVQILVDLNVPLPEVGFELAADSGAVLAEAELAWPAARLAVCVEGEAEQVNEFESAGWQVLLSATDGWPRKVAEILGETH